MRRGITVLIIIGIRDNYTPLTGTHNYLRRAPARLTGLTPVKQEAKDTWFLGQKRCPGSLD